MQRPTRLAEGVLSTESAFGASAHPRLTSTRRPPSRTGLHRIAPDRPAPPPCDNRRPMADRSDLAPARPDDCPAVSGATVAGFPTDRIARPTRRRAGVFQRALRREVSRLHDPHRLARDGDPHRRGRRDRGRASSPAASWPAPTPGRTGPGVRIWLNGGNPYAPTGPFLPYVYAPWMLPLFAPWALLPWDVAWFVWRGGAILLLFWTIHWAYRAQAARRPPIAILILAFPIAANLDTGNITLMLDVHALGGSLRRPADRPGSCGAWRPG